MENRWYCQSGPKESNIGGSSMSSANGASRFAARIARRAKVNRWGIDSTRPGIQWQQSSTMSAVSGFPT
jgi:hypothetical protein